MGRATAGIGQRRSLTGTRPVATPLVVLLALLATLLFSLALASRADAFVYWTGGDTIGRADLDGSEPDQSFITGLDNPRKVAVEDDYIYWAGSGPIGRANLDGTGVDESFISGVDASDVTVDANYVYWTYGTPTGPPPAPYSYGIGRANLDGTGVDQSFIDGLSAPAGALNVAVDASHIYWNSLGSSGGTAIGRANLDGTGVDESFAEVPPPSGLGCLFSDRGLAVDTNFLYLGRYCINFSIGADPQIIRAKLDGTDVDPDFIDPVRQSQDLAVDSSHVYWSIDAPNAIERANLDGTGIDRSFITGVDANGLALDALTFPETAITSGPDGPTNDDSPSFAFESDKPGSSFQCRLDSDAWSGCSSPKSYSQLEDGPHTFRVRATDQEGTTDPSPASRSFTVDTKIDGSASAKKAQKQKGKKIVVKAKVKAKEDLDATGTGKVLIRRRNGCLIAREGNGCKWGYKLKRVNKSVGSGRKKTLKLKPTSTGKRKLAEVVEKGRKATAKLKVKLSDEAGNKATTKLKVKLKR